MLTDTLDMTYSLSLNLPTVSVVGHKSPIYGQRKPYFKDQRQFKLVIENVLPDAVSFAYGQNLG